MHCTCAYFAKLQSSYNTRNDFSLQKRWKWNFMIHCLHTLTSSLFLFIFSLSTEPVTSKNNKNSFHFVFLIQFAIFFLFFIFLSDVDIDKVNFMNAAVEDRRNDDNYSCIYGSECSYCSCGYCDDEECRVNGNYSICERWVKFNVYEKFKWKKLYRKKLSRRCFESNNQRCWWSVVAA